MFDVTLSYTVYSKTAPVTSLLCKKNCFLYIKGQRGETSCRVFSSVSVLSQWIKMCQQDFHCAAKDLTYEYSIIEQGCLPAAQIGLVNKDDHRRL